MPCRKLQQFASHDFVEAMDAGDAVTEGDHRADFVDLDTGIVVWNLLPEELRDFVCLNLRHKVSSWLLVPWLQLFFASF